MPSKFLSCFYENKLADSRHRVSYHRASQIAVALMISSDCEYMANYNCKVQTNIIDESRLELEDVPATSRDQSNFDPEYDILDYDWIA